MRMDYNVNVLPNPMSVSYHDEFDSVVITFLPSVWVDQSLAEGGWADRYCECHGSLQ